MAEKVFISGDKSRLYVQRDGVIEMATGSKILGQSGVQAVAIADVETGGSATAAANATAINSILAALRAVGIIAS